MLFSSFMNLASLQYMLEEISAGNAIAKFSVLEEFDVSDLSKNAKIFDDALEDYRQEYEKLGMEPVRYAGVDAFVKEYLG